ncbi:MAG: bacteriophage holin [Ignavibacteria bacterium]|nr:bacteriophage holin [Ignavibacteria bacterium]MBT8381747.1 bacteriophage holin [Ignavibacteria bacterium]MBT8392562.1 bacteriophage holin [Ignavibacteria bacterium]NNJ53960.1 bacteriophage holin [Ignavibacteriaceae bacterium]NNL22090.1 bacteriophage holin [Ignavibacteriaceae bacterium]
MDLRKRALGLSIGLVWGFAILLTTWWFIIMGYQGEILGNLSGLYLGYSVSWGGSFIGFIWGFVDGFIAGVLIAWLYGVFSKMLYKKKPST